MGAKRRQLWHHRGADAKGQVMTQAATRSITWTRDRYLAAYRAGLLPDATELIAGDIVEVPTPDPIHEMAIKLLGKVLSDALKTANNSNLTCEKTSPLALSPTDQPAADIAIIPDDPKRFRHDHPAPDEVYLVVEVANSHPERDLKIKLPQYALAGIQEYWVLDLKRQSLVVHRDPYQDFYQSQQVWQSNKITLLRLPQVEVNVGDFLSDLFE